MNVLLAHGVPRDVWDALPLTPHYHGTTVWKDLDLDGLTITFFPKRSPGETAALLREAYPSGIAERLAHADPSES